MDGEFMSVRTWQGSIMVSTSLLPQSFDERTSYPNGSIRSNNSWESETLPRSQHRNNAHMVTATPPPPPPPPVPDYWHHGTQPTGGNGVGGGGGAAAACGNVFDFDANSFYAPSPPFDPAVSNPVYTPRTDDDAASIPEAYPLFSPWESVGAAFSYHPSGHEWGDASFATDPSLFPAAECYYSVPSTKLPAQAGTAWRGDGNVQSLRHETHFGLLPALSEGPGSMTRPRTDFAPVF
ncbi:hypothetical protein E4U55_001734 [Claviceps digitariae]|nr:hypothetical protein E4U55_001734 [Claviceps digitariae]